MIPVAHVEELYNHIVNGATTIDETRLRDSGEAYTRAFELLRIIAESDAGDIAEQPQPLGWGWMEFQPALASTLGAMKEDEYLILDVKFEHAFVQFAAQGAHGMRAEVSSNSVLPPQHQLSRPQLDRLRELGWNTPTGSLDKSTPVDDPHGSPNFFLDLPAPIDPEQLASLVINTFVEVLQVPYPGELTYSAWGHDGMLELPDLRLTDESRPAPAAPLPPPEPETPESVRAKLRQVMDQLTRGGAQEDEDGDFTLSVGSARVFIRVMSDMPAISVFSPFLMDVPVTAQTVARVNELNPSLRFVKVFLMGDTLIAAHELHADPFNWQHVHQAIVGVLHIADELDDQLQKELGGTLSTGERAETRPRPDAGYL